MASTAQITRSEGFVLTEERLRGLYDTIEKRFKTHSAPIGLIVKVNRRDDYSITANSVEDILHEGNEKNKRIKSLEFKSKTRAKFTLSLKLAYDSGIKVEIEGEDKDLVFLMKEDLRQFIDNNLSQNWWLATPRQPAMTFPLFLSSFFLTFVVFVVTQPKRPLARTTQTTESIRTADLDTKVQYLVDKLLDEDVGLYASKKLEHDQWFGKTFLWLLGTSLVIGMLQLLIEYVDPKNVFLIGDMKQIYERSEKGSGLFLRSSSWASCDSQGHRNLLTWQKEGLGNVLYFHRLSLCEVPLPQNEAIFS